MTLFKSWHKLLKCETLLTVTRTHYPVVSQSMSPPLLSNDIDVTWKSFKLGSGLLFWEAAADLSEPLQADQHQEQDIVNIVTDQFVFHFGTFEHSFYGLWLLQDSLTGDEILS